MNDQTPIEPLTPTIIVNYSIEMVYEMIQEDLHNRMAGLNIDPDSIKINIDTSPKDSHLDVNGFSAEFKPRTA